MFISKAPDIHVVKCSVVLTHCVDVSGMADSVRKNTYDKRHVEHASTRKKKHAEQHKGMQALSGHVLPQSFTLSRAHHMFFAASNI